MLGGGAERFPASPDWSIGIVLTVPPFPEELPGADPAEDPPLFYLAPPEADELPHYHLSDVRLEDGQLFARRRHRLRDGRDRHRPHRRGRAGGRDGARPQRRARPNLRWRTDIGDRFRHGEGERLRRMGWL